MTFKYDEPRLKCHMRAQPECDIFNQGSSYLNVTRTTVFHLNHLFYRSNEFDIPHYSRKSRCRQQTTRIAIGIINKESDGRAGSNYLHIPRRESAFSTLADRRRACEMSVSARLGWGYVCLASCPVHFEGSWRLAYALIRPDLLYYCCRNT